MKFNDKTRWRAAAGLGVAGAAFAGLLALVNVTPLSESAKKAADAFAVSIPLNIASYYAERVWQSVEQMRCLGWVLYGVFVLAGRITCIIGAYWLVDHVYPHAASRFFWAGFACLVVVWLMVYVFWRKDLRDEFGLSDRKTDSQANAGSGAE